MSALNGGEEATEGYVTVVTGGQLFGLKLARVRDVFLPRGLSKVPLAPKWRACSICAGASSRPSICAGGSA